LAAVLNLFLYGLGYVYIGKRKTFGILLFLGNIAFYAALGWALYYPLPQTANAYVDINGVGFAVIGIAFAYDAHRLAEESDGH
jgi:hypothetical protein